MIVVEGPAGIGKSTLLAAAGRIARADGATVLRARCSPLEQDAAWGMARQLFEPLRSRPEWDELTVGAAGLAERALAPEAGEPAPAGDAMHAAARGLVWLASNLGERGPAVLVVDDVHWADAPSLRWLALLAPSLGELPIGVLCAVRSGEPAAAPELLAELLARAPEPPVRPRALGPGGDGDAGARAAARGERRVRARLPRRHRRQPVPARRAAHPARSPTASRPDDEAAARLGTFGSEQVARVVERQLARLPDGAGRARPRGRRPRPRRAVAARRRLARLEPPPRRAPPTRCAPPGCSRTGPSWRSRIR